MKIITFFSDKGRESTASFVYHLAWMLGLNGVRTLAVDLDPYSTLTSLFLTNEQIELLSKENFADYSLLKAIQSSMNGLGEVILPKTYPISPNINFIPGDLSLVKLDQHADDAWHGFLNNTRDGEKPEPTTFFRVIHNIGKTESFDLVFVVTPNIGAMFRVSMLFSDGYIVLLNQDQHSWLSLISLGDVLQTWRKEWHKSVIKVKNLGYDLIEPNSHPLGYVLLTPSIRVIRPTQSIQKWIDRIPGVYANHILGQDTLKPGYKLPNPDPNCLGTLKDYKSLMPMAMDAGKPMFLLKPADGAIGGHASAVQDCYTQYFDLAKRISCLAGISHFFSAGNSAV